MTSSSLYQGMERRKYTVLPYAGRERRTSVQSRSVVAEEQTLVRRAMGRDRAAFARLYDRFVDKIFRYVHFRVADRALAEELTAQVFVQAWKTMTNYPQPSYGFPIWLYRIAHKTVQSHLQTQRAAQRPEPEAAGQGSALIDALPEALDQLTEEQQQIMVLRFLEGYDAEQVAQLLDKPLEEVRTAQYQALSRLSRIVRKGAAQ